MIQFGYAVSIRRSVYLVKYLFKFYDPSSLGISSCVRTAHMVMYLHTIIFLTLFEQRYIFGKDSVTWFDIISDTCHWAQQIIFNSEQSIS